jgi:FkbM family methyltransferase
VLYKLLRQIEVRSQWTMGKGYSAPVEREVALALRAAGGSPAVVVDGGANVGDWSAAVLAQHSPERLLLIEPDPGNAARLRTRFADTKIATVAEVALSDQSGEATLFADSSGSGLGSLHNRDLSASGIAFNPMATVKTDTIAGLMNEHVSAPSSSSSAGPTLIQRPTSATSGTCFRQGSTSSGLHPLALPR